MREEGGGSGRICEWEDDIPKCGRIFSFTVFTNRWISLSFFINSKVNKRYPKISMYFWFKHRFSGYLYPFYHHKKIPKCWLVFSIRLKPIYPEKYTSCFFHLRFYLQIFSFGVEAKHLALTHSCDLNSCTILSIQRTLFETCLGFKKCLINKCVNVKL